MEAHAPLLVLTTCPDREIAQEIATRLVKSRLAACVNILPKGISIYEWQNSLETTEEHVLLIKTQGDRYPELESTLRSIHPYELPEVIAVPLVRGLPEYLSWIDQQTR
jgi:periplasmic divalent cation tolerance protein